MKLIKIGIMLLLALFTMTPYVCYAEELENSEEIKEYQITDEVIDDIDYSLYEDENKNIQFMNDFLNRIGVKSDYETVEDFTTYADENYLKFVKNVDNCKIIQESTKITVCIYNNEFYVIHHIETDNTNVLLASFNNDTIGYKKFMINYSYLKNDAKFYVIKLETRKLPLNSVSLNSSFGYRIDPLTGEAGAFHSGMDLQGSEGDPIYATEEGICHVYYDTEGYGYHIEIEHKDGISTLYAHCSELLVNEGQNVKAGELIAYVGATGRVTGPHLHFEYRINGEPIDPTEYLESCK